MVKRGLREACVIQPSLANSATCCLFTNGSPVEKFTSAMRERNDHLLVIAESKNAFCNDIQIHFGRAALDRVALGAQH